MKKIALMVGVAGLALSATAAMADSAAPVALTQEADHGVLVYIPDFFVPYAPNTALDMVNRVPGFSVNDGDGTRGFEGAVGNILINGSRPASKTDTGSAVLGRTQARQVERIELIRGGVPGIEMQGYAVVINVVLKTDSQREHVVNLSSSFFKNGPDLYGGSYQYSDRRGDYAWSLTLSDGISQTDSSGTGPVRRYDADGQILHEEAYDNYGYGGSQSLRGTWTGPVLGGKLDLTARIGKDDWLNEAYQTAPDVRREDRDGNTRDLAEFGAVYTRDIRPGLKSETRFIHESRDREGLATSWAIVEGQPLYDDVFTSDSLASETILRSLVRYQHSPSLDFELGGEVAYNSLESHQAFIASGVRIDLPSDDIKVEELRGEVFGKSTWRLNPQWSFEAGLRLENSIISQSGDANQEKSFFFAKPRLQATWTPFEKTQVRLRLEHLVGQLNFSDFAASASLEEDNLYGGNADLVPEQRTVAELTLEQRFWEDAVFNLGLRHDEIKDVIDYMPLEGGGMARGNIGDGTYDHLFASLNLPLDRVAFKGARLSLKNTWKQSEVTDPTTGEARRISSLRHSQPEITVLQAIPSWNIQWQLSYLPRIQEASYNPGGILSWRGSDYWDASVEYKPRPDTSIRLMATYWDAFDIYRTQYTNRAAGQIAFTEERLIQPRFFYQIRLRKSF